MANPEKSSYPERVIDGRTYARVCRTSGLFETRGRQVVFDEDQDMQVAIFKQGGSLYALSNICPHRHQDRIHEGIIRNGNVTCPVHGWTYSLDTGENTDKRQGIRSLVKYDVFEENGYIWLEKPDKSIVPPWRRD